MRKLAIFRRLIVLLDGTAPSQGAFIHALEWAWRLQLPIHAWALPELDTGERSPKPVEPWDPVSVAPLPAASFSDSSVTTVDACVSICAEWDVKLGLTRIEGVPSQWFGQNLRPDDLLIVSYTPTRTERLALVQQVLQQPAAVLLCPKVWRGTLSRMLVLYRSCEQNQQTLATAMQLCRCVRATPVVFTVAHSQHHGCRLQQPARTAFAEHSQRGNFDLVIGADVAEAAARVARWRQCQLVVMGRYGRKRWAHWFGSTTERLIKLADSLAVLTIPRRQASDLDAELGDESASLGKAFRWRGSADIPQGKLGGW
jgi:nucleotide-binding universal stress UspA family protein